MEEVDKDQLLEDFMKEFFPFNDLVKLGFFTKEMKGDYKAQADRVCKFLKENRFTGSEEKKQLKDRIEFTKARIRALV